MKNIKKIFRKVKRTLTSSSKPSQEVSAKEKCIAAVCNNTGISRAEALEIIHDAMERLDIKWVEYRLGKFWEIPVENQAEAYETYKAKLEIKKAEKAEIIRKRILANEKIVHKVCEESGMDYDTVKAMMLESREKIGCRFKDYQLHRFYNKDLETQAKFFIMANSKPIRKKYNSKLFERIARDKYLTNTLFNDYISRAWCLNKVTNFDEFCSIFKDVPKIIYKPQAGTQGKGIKSFCLTKENIHDIYDEIQSLPEGIVEEYLIQHKDLMALNPSSVNTLRFVTVSWREGKNTIVDIAYSALRIGNGKIVDNLHSGGMAAAVDLETGRLCTHAADHLIRVFTHHPATGVEIKGMKVPHFFKAKEYIKNIILTEQICGYCAWDIAITEKGPELIEINSNPGPDVLQIPYTPEGKGMAYVMEKYM